MLVSMKSYIGDAVMTIPLLEQIDSAVPEMVVQTSGAVRFVLEGICAPEQIAPSFQGRSPFKVIAAARALKAQRFDAVILVNHSFRSALIVRLAGIPRRIGHSSEGRDFLLTDAQQCDEKEFESFSIAALAAPLGLTPVRQRPLLHVSDQERTRGVELLHGATIGFQPGARHAYRTTPIDKVAAIARSLQADGHKLVMVGGKEEVEIAAKVEGQLQEPVVNLVGKTSIRETIGCLASLRACFGNDTGVMHLSAASGCPTVQIFGSYKVDKWGHAYPPHRVLKAPDDDLTRVDEEEVVEAVLQAARGRD